MSTQPMTMNPRFMGAGVRPGTRLDPVRCDPPPHLPVRGVIELRMITPQLLVGVPPYHDARCLNAVVNRDSRDPVVDHARRRLLDLRETFPLVMLIHEDKAA